MNNVEYFPIVNENGEVIGRSTRQECHSGTKQLHPVIHLHIFDPQGRLYLQKRAITKDIQPGKWDTAVGGHVDYGETVEKALLREAREELGIKDFKYTKLFSYIFESKIERELVNTFYTTNFKGTMTIDPVEVDEGRFWTIDEIKKAIGTETLTPNFEGEFERLLNAINNIKI